MRIKNFTLIVLALLMSTVSFAQKPANISQILKQNVALQQRLSKAPLQFFNKDVKKVRSQQATAAKKAPAKASEVVVPPTDGEVVYYKATGTAYGGSKVERTVTVVWDGLEDVYISGLSYYAQDSYIHGTLVDENTVVFPMGQYLGLVYGQYPMYAYGMNSQYKLVDIQATYDGDEDTFTFNTYVADCNEEGTAYTFIADFVLAPSDDIDLPVEAPVDLVTEDYVYIAADLTQDDQPLIFHTIKLGFYGDDVYVQGISTDLPEAWVRGTRDGNKITFPTGQMLGNYNASTLWFLGANGSTYSVEDMVFEYDEENGILSSNQVLFISRDKNEWIGKLRSADGGVSFKKVVEKVGTPLTPSITGVGFFIEGDILEMSIPLVDKEYNGMVGDKLAYKVYCDKGEGEPQLVTFSTEDYTKLKEEMTEIPLNFTDNNDFASGPSIFLNMKDYTTWKRIGVQSIYYGGGERRESEIGWYTPVWPTYKVTPPADMAKTVNTFKGFFPGDDDEDEPFETSVVMGFVDDSVYVRGIGTENEYTWVKGVKTADDTYTFANGQYLGDYDDYYRLFLVGLDETGKELADVVLKKDAGAGVYTFVNTFYENAGYTDRPYYLNVFLSEATISIQGESLAPVQVPEGLVTDDYAYKGVSYTKEVNVSNAVKVGFNGADVYVQGFSTDMPNAWVKGTLNEGTVTFATGQFLGGEDEDEVYFIGYNVKTKEIVDVVFNYNSESNTFEIADADVAVAINAYKDQINKSIYQADKNVTMTKVNVVAATPAAPVVTRLRFTTVGNVLERSIPLQDVDGNDLVADKLSYVVLADTGEGEPAVVTFTKDLYPKLEADMTEIPAKFIDNWDFYTSALYLNMDHSTWKRIGLQSIYRGGNEERRSEITWYTITWPVKNALPEGLTASPHDFKGTRWVNGLEREYSSVVNIAISEDQNDFYIQGLGIAGSEGWVKGTKNADGNYVFRNGQFMGTYNTKVQGSDVTYTLFFTGVEVDEQTQSNSTTDVTLLTDITTGVWKFQNSFSENKYYTDSVNPNSYFLAGATISFAGTGINGVEADKVAGKAVRYNMAGQRVSANYKGIVVEQGRKIVVK